VSHINALFSLVTGVGWRFAGTRVS